MTDNRRQLLRDLGVGVAVLPFIGSLSSLAAAPEHHKQRLVIMFSPNGVVPWNFWPDEKGKGFTFHRGVFVARSILGRGLRSPPEAIELLDEEIHPDSSSSPMLGR